MFFVDKEHEDNFNKLMELYNLVVEENVEYESAIYVAAYPKIFKCYNLEHLDTSCGPLIHLFDGYDEEELHDAGALTSSTRALIQAGQSLYNGHEARISSVCSYGQETLEVFIQACRIRAKAKGRCHL
ncbi:hypothetical protein BAQ46_14915 [Bacillus paranthracis]|uniref:hypothetical protein n=1 Tax=Bacillus paranthracis TaxID=2026186 RepID=UPI0008FDA837|nr:hypothetical protein [Bacillus paranthracis]OJE23970.1 hypothetical protein BAQ46_14915 [Bacillus paranthracis]